MIVEIKIAGTAIKTEFQKYPFKPSQLAPVQAVPQAFSHASKLNDLGRENMVPLRISSKSLNEVIIITNKGSK